MSARPADAGPRGPIASELDIRPRGTAGAAAEPPRAPRTTAAPAPRTLHPTKESRRERARRAGRVTPDGRRRAGGRSARHPRRRRRRRPARRLRAAAQAAARTRRRVRGAAAPLPRGPRLRPARRRRRRRARTGRPGGVPARRHGRDRRRGLRLRRPHGRLRPPRLRPTSADRFLHGLAHLAVAAMAFPRPEDLADDGYIGRVTVNGVDAFVRQACRRLEERAEEQGENTDPATDAPGLEAAWRIWARRSATGATKDARRLAGSTTGIVGKAVAFLTDSGFLQRTGDDAGRHLPHHRPLPAPGARHGGQRRHGRAAGAGRRPGHRRHRHPAARRRTPTTWSWSPTPACPSTPDRRPTPAPADPTAPTPRPTTRVRRHVRAVPGPPLLHRARRCALRRHRARPARRRRARARPRARPRRSSSRTSRSARRAARRPRACSSWRTAAASPSCSS